MVTNNLDTTTICAEPLRVRSNHLGQVRASDLPIAPADSASLSKVSVPGRARHVWYPVSPVASQWALGSALQNAKTLLIWASSARRCRWRYRVRPIGPEMPKRRLLRPAKPVMCSDQYSLFGNASYEVLAEGFKADLGLRWFHSYRIGSADHRPAVLSPGQPTGAEPFQAFGQDVLFKSFELSYALGGDALTYVQGGTRLPLGADRTDPVRTQRSPRRRIRPILFGTTRSVPSWGFRQSAATGIRRFLTSNGSNLQVLLPMPLFSYISNDELCPVGWTLRASSMRSSRVTFQPRRLDSTYTNARLVGEQPFRAFQPRSCVPAISWRGSQNGPVPRTCL